MSTLKWWASKLRSEQPGFVRVVTDPRPERRGGTLTIEFGEARVVVGAGVDAELLAMVVGVLRGATA